MTTAEEKYFQSQRKLGRPKSYSMTVLVSLAFAVVACTLLLAFWHTGAFLPGWIDWKSYRAVIDSNGNGQNETLILANRHLTITDYEANRYVSPHDWLVSDVHIGDVTQDGTPEVLALVWRHESDNTGIFPEGTFDSQGFSQHVCIFDYSHGELETIWVSPPLRSEARFSSLDEDRKLQACLSGYNFELRNGDGKLIVAPKHLPLDKA